jgi:hypothetical protein
MRTFLVFFLLGAAAFAQPVEVGMIKEGKFVADKAAGSTVWVKSEAIGSTAPLPVTRPIAVSNFAYDSEDMSPTTLLQVTVPGRGQWTLLRFPAVSSFVQAHKQKLMLTSFYGRAHYGPVEVGLFRSDKGILVPIGSKKLEGWGVNPQKVRFFYDHLNPVVLDTFTELSYTIRCNETTDAFYVGFRSSYPNVVDVTEIAATELNLPAYVPREAKGGKAQMPEVPPREMPRLPIEK